MALIPVQHVVCPSYPVDPDWDFATQGTIQAGRVVSLDGAGNVMLANSAGAHLPLGLAADNLMNVGGGTSYAANLVLGAAGVGTQFTQNRVSDYFNETVASGLMAVYHGGGSFLTDQFATVTFVPGIPVYADATGQVTNVVVAAFLIGICTTTTAAYPSGVPGTDIQGSISLGNYLGIALRI